MPPHCFIAGGAGAGAVTGDPAGHERAGNAAGAARSRGTAPPRPEPPAVRPLQDSAPSGPAVRQPRDLSPWSMFLAADIVVKAVMVSLAFASLVTWTIFFAKTRAAIARAGAACRALARSPRRTPVGGAKGARRQAHGVCLLVRAALHEVRLSGEGASEPASRSAARPVYRDRARRSACMRFGMATARHHRRDLAVRRAVRHGLGHHEQLHRHFQSADDKPRGGGARHRRSLAGDRDRSGRRDPGGDHLQPFLARDQSVPGICRPRLRRGRAAVVARSRSVARPAVARAAE